MQHSPIGIFDSGYGGLTVLRKIHDLLPRYDYLYLGDNKRAPYGTKDFNTVYAYTLQAVQWFFDQGCPLVILACNTASAKALRTIQQNDLPAMGPTKRVLGVIRPTAEVIGKYSNSKHIGVLGTQGTVSSRSYILEMEKFFPEAKVSQHACPQWVDIVENDRIKNPDSAAIIKADVDQLFAKDNEIDCILLACTHYPLLQKEINKHLPENVKLLAQGEIVAHSLEDYLERHQSVAQSLSTGKGISFYTTGSTKDFDEHGSTFFGRKLKSAQVKL